MALKMNPVVKSSDGTQITGLVSAAKYFAKIGHRKDLLGNDAAEAALINQWMEYRVTQIDRSVNDHDLSSNLKELNEYLTNKVFLVGQHLTLADILLYQSLHPLYEQLSFYDKQQLVNLSRWFDQVQHTTNLRQDRSKIYFQRTQLYTKTGSH